MFLFVNYLNKCLYSEYYDNFSRLRYQTFIEELNWNVPHKNGREYDQFDHEAAHYIILIDQSRKVVGGIRLIPTESPHMLRDVFSYLVEGHQTPIGSTTWEISRLVIKKSSDSSVSDMQYRFQELIHGLTSFAILHNIQEYVSVSEARVERLFRIAGLPMKRLGNVSLMDGVHVVATSIEINEKVLKDVKSKYFHLGFNRFFTKEEHEGGSIPCIQDSSEVKCNQIFQ